MGKGDTHRKDAKLDYATANRGASIAADQNVSRTRCFTVEGSAGRSRFPNRKAVFFIARLAVPEMRPASLEAFSYDL